MRICARFARAKGGEVVHFLRTAQKMNHIPLPFASEASADCRLTNMFYDFSFTLSMKL